MNVIKIDISKNNNGGKAKAYSAHGSHSDHTDFFLNTNSTN